ncbi:MAG: hypothetical protein ACLF0G_16720 [Candidatus Brocadiia bacterium]
MVSRSWPRRRPLLPRQCPSGRAEPPPPPLPPRRRGRKALLAVGAAAVVALAVAAIVLLAPGNGEDEEAGNGNGNGGTQTVSEALRRFLPWAARDVRELSYVDVRQLREHLDPAETRDLAQKLGRLWRCKEVLALDVAESAELFMTESPRGGRCIVIRTATDLPLDRVVRRIERQGTTEPGSVPYVVVRGEYDEFAAAKSGEGTYCIAEDPDPLARALARAAEGRRPELGDELRRVLGTVRGRSAQVAATGEVDDLGEAGISAIAIGCSFGAQPRLEGSICYRRTDTARGCEQRLRRLVEKLTEEVRRGEASAMDEGALHVARQLRLSVIGRTVELRLACEPQFLRKHGGAWNVFEELFLEGVFEDVFIEPLTRHGPRPEGAAVPAP